MDKQISKINSLKDLENRARLLQDELNGKTVISICSGTGCKAYASEEVHAAIEDEIKRISKNDPAKIKNIVIKRTGCHGYCERGPIMVIHPEETCYMGVKKEDVPEIVEKTIIGDVVEKFVYKDETGSPVFKESDIPFYKFQKRIILDSNSKIDPTSIDDYIRIGGYQALAKCLTGMTPDEVLKEVKDANLRGRGGGGFPAGGKWETVKNASGEPRYVIVNADEGDPGAYMDRSILEGNPHSVLEGLIIAAYAIGAS
ncbi:MAG: NADH-quinone oxidoreductase subunit F, partial [Actinobacteria bacterium]|nr:NADH-quinone oxidoreductase subunit F [Actinomycetota bacterium]